MCTDTHANIMHAYPASQDVIRYILLFQNINPTPPVVPPQVFRPSWHPPQSHLLRRYDWRPMNPWSFCWTAPRRCTSGEPRVCFFLFLFSEPACFLQPKAMETCKKLNIIPTSSDLTCFSNWMMLESVRASFRPFCSWHLSVTRVCIPCSL